MTQLSKIQVDCRGRVAEAEVVGTGPDVVFVGTAVPMAWTRLAAGALAALGFRVTNFDYGVGSPDPEPRTALDQVEDVIAVMDAADVSTATVVGLSRGAMTAFGLASRHPDRVDGLVLSFPVAGWEDTLHIVDPDPTPVEGEDPQVFITRLVERIFSEHFLSDHLDAAVALITTEPGSVARVDRHDEEPFTADESVSCRTLIIEGEADRVVKTEHPRRYLAAVEGAEHVVIDGAEHGWMMEEPHRFASIVADFSNRG